MMMMMMMMMINRNGLVLLLGVRLLIWTAVALPVPEAWPAHVVYVSSALRVDELKPTTVVAALTREVVPLLHDSLEVRFLPHDHAAYDRGRGRGVFATRDIPADTALGEYAGLFLPSAATYTRQCRYCIMFEGLRYGVDGGAFGNELRFLNNFGGIASRRNVRFNEISDDDGAMRLVVYTTHDVIADEELLIGTHPYNDGDYDALTCAVLFEQMLTQCKDEVLVRPPSPAWCAA